MNQINFDNKNVMIMISYYMNDFFEM